ncbi:MAG: hypothetical protein H0V44_15890 [Planctomycetes bacterium]|nr:hypothetical protein [Planctomycetota bacterium]
MGDRRSNMRDIREAEAQLERRETVRRLRRWRVPSAIAAAALAVLIFLFRPVYAPLDEAQIRTMEPPIQERTDRDFYLKVFQKRDGRWYQCKTWISRNWFG